MTRSSARERPCLDIPSQHEHFKTSQASILKTLTTASSLNGSSFILVSVSPNDTFQVHASPCLQPQVDKLFTPWIRTETEMMARLARRPRVKYISAVGRVQKGKAEKGDISEEYEDEADASVSEAEEAEASKVASSPVEEVKVAKEEATTVVKSDPSSLTSAPIPTPTAGPSSFGDGNLAFLFSAHETQTESEGSGQKNSAGRRSSGRSRSGLGVEVRSVASPRTKKRIASVTALEGTATEKKTKGKSKAQGKVVVDQENSPLRPVVEHQQQPRTQRHPLGQSNHHLHQTFHHEYQLRDERASPRLQPQHIHSTPVFSHSPVASAYHSFPHHAQYAPSPPIPQHHYHGQQYSPYASTSAYPPPLDPYAPPPAPSLQQTEFYPVSTSNDHLASFPIQRTYSAPPPTSTTHFFAPPPPPRPASRVEQLSIGRSHSFDAASTSYDAQWYSAPPATPSMGQGEFGGSVASEQEYSGLEMPGRGVGLGITMGGGEYRRTQSPLSLEGLRFGDEYQ